MTHYDLLGVVSDASYDDIKRAWRSKARATHPDGFRTEVDKRYAHELFIQLSEAYQVLIDPHRRAIYDASLLIPAQAAAYRGYGSSDPARDQAEVKTMWDEVWKETGWQFAKGSLRTFVGLLVWGGIAAAMVWVALTEGTSKWDTGTWFWVVASIGIAAAFIYEGRERIRRARTWFRLRGLGISGPGQRESLKRLSS